MLKTGKKPSYVIVTLYILFYIILKKASKIKNIILKSEKIKYYNKK